VTIKAGCNQHFSLPSTVNKQTGSCGGELGVQGAWEGLRRSGFESLPALGPEGVLRLLLF
jgi:hypothetical protein